MRIGDHLKAREPFAPSGVTENQAGQATYRSTIELQPPGGPTGLEPATSRLTVEVTRPIASVTSDEATCKQYGVEDAEDQAVRAVPELNRQNQVLA